MDEIRPNTDSYREKSEASSSEQEEKRVVRKVVDGKVVAKNNKMRKLAGAFFADDISNIGEHLVNEVFIPKVKKFMADSLDACVDVIFYGEKGRPKERTSASRYNYSRSYDDRERERHRDERRTVTRRQYDYRDIITPTRREAEDIIIGLEDLIKRYGIATVRDLYDLCGLGSDYTDCKYGWTNVSSAKITSTRDGYLIDLPTAVAID
ncbi:MAG: hypothetical protein LIP10_03675 [Clostridiales bacterium]|nr:hypothetical protein [Clostridiales bacterium]